MINYYKNFYKDIYEKFDGYIPLWPLMSEAELGDLIIIRHGQMIKIGNILDEAFGVYEEVSIEDGWSTPSDSWNIQSGVHHSYTSKNNTSDPSIPNGKSGLMLEFDSPGAYIFNAPEINYRTIDNFYAFKFKLLQQLAAEKCSFREVFVVTSIAKTQAFSLMIANDSDAHVLISSAEDGIPYNFNKLTGTDCNPKITEMRSINPCHLNHKGGQLFFKAQKLDFSNQGKDIISKYLKQNSPPSFQNNARNILRFVPSQMLPSTDLFPAKIHELFHFREMNLNDVSDFFGNR